MKCIYSALRPAVDQKSYVDWITNCNQKCSVSTKGLVAFTSSFCLNQPKPQTISYHVYVADLNKPYQPYLLCECEHDFTLIEWDPTGTKLLLCDCQGFATIYTSKDFLISDWKPYFKQSFSAERFITACWYHPGIVSSINVAQGSLKTSSNHLEYTDKIQQSKFAASLRLFGAKAAEGCLLISQTGLVCCLTLMADSTVDVVSESLNPLRTKLHAADVSYSKDGSFIVGTSCGFVNSTIAFYKVSLSIKNITLDEIDSFSMGICGDAKRIQVTSKRFHSFHLNVMAQMLTERENTCTFEHVNHIKFVSKDSPNDVLVEISGQNLSLIELWELETKRRSPVHSAILELKRDSKPTQVTIKQEPIDTPNGSQQQQMAATKQKEDDLLISEWSFKGNYITDKNLIAMQVPKFRLFGSHRQLNIILLAYQDSSVCCLRKDDLQPVGEPLKLCTSVPTRYSNSHLKGKELDTSPYKTVYNGNNGNFLNRNMAHPNGGHYSSTTNPSKPVNKQKLNFITDLQLSTNQTVFVAVDSMSQLHVVKLPPMINCQDQREEETYLQYLLEYCLVTGNDWWDVIVCTRRSCIETICDKFHDAYERQSKHIQRKYFNRQLMIRASLHRCLNDAASLCKSSDCHTMIMLNSIASTHKSMLRSHDRDSPSEQLSQFLRTQGTQPGFFNANNVLAKINEREFYIEAQLIQCLQPLNQWIADLSVYLIAALQQQRLKSKINHLPGAGLVKNKEALETLRELLIIIKIWGKQNPAGLPVIYRLNDQIDIIGQLFKMISVHYAALNNLEPAESLLDECTHLTNNITVTHFEYLLAACGVASPSLHCCANGKSNDAVNSTRLVMEYFHEHKTPELINLDKIEGSIDMKSSRKIDIVRNISLGAHPLTNVRHCTRCRGMSLMRPSFNTTRSWEQRWMTTCVCGGHWAQSDTMFASKIRLALINNTNNAGSLTQLAGQLARKRPHVMMKADGPLLGRVLSYTLQEVVSGMRGSKCGFRRSRLLGVALEDEAEAED